ncbi:MAG: hypothetical protein JWQ27_2389 [Ferruginibacter sp.]|nr:hypothetical protein [Ferruginibacter sp.]
MNIIHCKQRKTMLFLLLSIFIVQTGFSQARSGNEIVAEGGAKVRVRPDLAIILLTVEKRDTVEKEAIKMLNKEVTELVKSLNKIGFTNNVIKISDYDIGTRESEDNKPDYVVTNSLKLEFSLDRKLIDALYAEVQDAGLSNLEIAFDTKVSDSLEKLTRIQLVQRSIIDARTNASNIASALGIKLLRVKQVLKYREGGLLPPEINEVKFTPPKIDGANDIYYKTSFNKFEVEDIELEEKVTIIYEIGQ